MGSRGGRRVSRVETSPLLDQTPSRPVFVPQSHFPAKSLPERITFASRSNAQSSCFPLSHFPAKSSCLPLIPFPVNSRFTHVTFSVTSRAGKIQRQDRMPSHPVFVPQSHFPVKSLSGRVTLYTTTPSPHRTPNHPGVTGNYS